MIREYYTDTTNILSVYTQQDLCNNTPLKYEKLYLYCDLKFEIYLWGKY